MLFCTNCVELKHMSEWESPSISGPRFSALSCISDFIHVHFCSCLYLGICAFGLLVLLNQNCFPDNWIFSYWKFRVIKICGSRCLMCEQIGWHSLNPLCKRQGKLASLLRAPLFSDISSSFLCSLKVIWDYLWGTTRTQWNTHLYQPTQAEASDGVSGGRPSPQAAQSPLSWRAQGRGTASSAPATRVGRDAEAATSWAGCPIWGGGRVMSRARPSLVQRKGQGP